MTRLIVVVALIVLANPLLAQQPALQHVEVTVAGTNDEWTPTTLTVAPGDLVLIQAEGRVKVGQVLGEVTANGVDANSGTGALEMKIGVGAAQRVGAHAFVAPEQTGAVKLRVHDTKYEDNSGSFTVSVLLVPARAIPKATPVGGS